MQESATECPSLFINGWNCSLTTAGITSVPEVISVERVETVIVSKVLIQTLMLFKETFQQTPRLFENRNLCDLQGGWQGNCHLRIIIVTMYPCMNAVASYAPRA